MDIGQTNPPKRDEIGKCPLCGKPVYENKKAFGCSGYRDGCKFTLWKENKYLAAFGFSLTKPMVVGFLSAKHRCLITGIKKKDNSGTYAARFIMTIKDGYPHFEVVFANKRRW